MNVFVRQKSGMKSWLCIVRVTGIGEKKEKISIFVTEACIRKSSALFFHCRHLRSLGVCRIERRKERAGGGKGKF